MNKKGSSASLRSIEQMECWSTGILGFITPSLHHSNTPVSVAAAANLRRTARGLERFFAELDVDDLIVGRFFVCLNVAILDAVVDGPLGAFPGKARVDAPDAIFHQVIVGEADSLLRLLRRFHHNRDDFFFLVVDDAVGFNEGSRHVAYHGAVLGEHAVGRAVSVKEIFRHQLGEIDEHVQARLFLLCQVDIFRMERHAVELTGEKTRQSSGSGLRNELDIFHFKTGGLEHLAAHYPVKAAHTATGGAKPLAFKVRSGLDFVTHHVSMRQSWRHAPKLLCLKALGYGGGVDRGHRLALGYRR